MHVESLKVGDVSPMDATVDATSAAKPLSALYRAWIFLLNDEIVIDDQETGPGFRQWQAFEFSCGRQLCIRHAL